MRLTGTYRPINVWYEWFAWYPVRMELSGRKFAWVWLERVECYTTINAYDTWNDYRFLCPEERER